MTTTPRSLESLAHRESIKRCRQMIDQQYQLIEHIAISAIDDYHFLDYCVSSFWECDESPVGMCIYHVDEETNRPTKCRYCGGPVERK